jgi:glycosyltransferase involved in cell wall biosynthesis
MMKNEKILFLVQLPPPIHGSALVNQLLINSEVLNDRFQVEVMPTQIAGSMEDIGSFSLRKLWKAISICYLTFFKLLTKKYTLVYLTLSPLSFAFYKDAILVFLTKAFGNKVVLHLHGKGIKNQIKSRLKKKIYKSVFKNTEVIILSENLYEDIAEIFPKRPHILPNGISELPNFDIAEEYTSDKTTFIYLSNLRKDKGIFVFLEAIRLLKPIENKFSINVAGPSADVTIKEVKSYIKRHNIDNANVVGPAYGKEKYSYLKMSDVFVLPSKNECFPLTILEAYQSGLAVISTNTGAIPYIVKNNHNGFVVTPEDPVELAERMKQIIEDRDLLFAMKARNKKEYQEKYTSEIFIQNFVFILDTILKDNEQYSKG